MHWSLQQMYILFLYTQNIILSSFCNHSQLMCDYYRSFMSYYWGILHIFQRLLSVISNTLTKLLYSFLKYIENVLIHNCPNDTIHYQSLLWFNYNLVSIELLDMNWARVYLCVLFLSIWLYKFIKIFSNSENSYIH